MSDIYTKLVIEVFRDNRCCYGTRRIKAACKEMGVVLSRRRIGRIMRNNGLVSTYTKKHFKVHSSKCNEAEIANILNRGFNGKERNEVIVSDLTYVLVNNRWHYICTLIDLSNREIIGYSVGAYKTASLVLEAFASVKRDLNYIHLFHSDRGKEFDNIEIDKLLLSFGIKRSLSKKGTPYDNAVAEATYKTIKTEFVYGNTFNTLEELKNEFMGYVWWYNNKRLHSTLNYMSPITYAQQLSL